MSLLILEQNFLKNGGVVRSCVQIACFLHQNDCCVNQFYVGRILLLVALVGHVI